MSVREIIPLKGSHEIIGHGGAGLVYAWDRTTALKTPRIYNDSTEDEATKQSIREENEEARRRIEWEKKILGQIGHHPHIIRTLAIKDEGIYMLRYQELPTVDLDEKKLFVDILRAVVYLHKHNIAHADLCSDNFLFSKNTNDFILADFDNAASFGSPVRRYRPDTHTTVSAQSDLVDLGYAFLEIAYRDVGPEAQSGPKDLVLEVIVRARDGQYSAAEKMLAEMSSAIWTQSTLLERMMVVMRGVFDWWSR